MTSPAAGLRWPMFGREASAAGAAAVFAFPLQIGAVPFGVLELYRNEPGQLSEDELASAVLLVDTGARLVLADFAGLTSGAGEPAPVFGREEIPIATGVIAAQLGVSISQALVELRTAAFSANRPITDVAADVLNGQITFSPSHPPPA